jgi:hypothetical protein
MLRPDNWTARLVRVQVALSTAGERIELAGEEDRWPARLIHAGAVLLGASGAVLAAWLRRRLQQ